MKGTIILTVTAFFTKILSMLYKIPYQNVVGDEGLYVFQQVYPLVGVYTILNGVVLPTVISELLLTYQYSDGIKRYIKRSLWMIGLASFALLFLGSNMIAIAMGDAGLSSAIRVVGLAFLFMPILSYLRGVMQANPNTIRRLGYSTTIEQLVRVTMIIMVLVQLRGHNMYQIAYFSYLLGLGGPILAILYLWLFKGEDVPSGTLNIQTRPHFFKKSLYLFLSAGILILFQLIDSFVVFNSLVASGISEVNAMQLKGVFERGLPIVQTATFFVGAIISGMVPQMSKLKDEKSRHDVFNTAVFFVFALAIPACIGLFVVMDDLNATLFIDNAGSDALRILSIQVVLYAFVFLTTAVLQQEGKYSQLLVSVLAGILVKLVLTAPLTESLGINGTAISSVSALGVMFLINSVQFRKMFYPKTYFNLLRITAAALGMWWVVDRTRPWIMANIFFHEGRTYNMNLLFAQAGIGIVVYGVLLFLLLWVAVITNDIKKRKKRQRRKRQMEKL